MNYKETLDVVRQQNPDKSYRECQKIASELHEKYKAGLEALKAQQAIIHPDATAAPASNGAQPQSPRLAGALPLPELVDADKQIRKGPVDCAKVMSIGLQVIPDGKIVNYGKAENGVNSLVCFEDSTGNRLPVDGFYEVFIMGR